MVAFDASVAADVADERHGWAKHRLHALASASGWGVGRCVGHSEYLSCTRRALGLKTRRSRFVALFAVANVPVAGWLAVLLRCSSASATISATASARLISFQVRVGLGMLAALIELAEHLLAGQLEQFVGGNRRDGLLEVAHGIKPRAIQPGLAEPSD